MVNRPLVNGVIKPSLHSTTCWTDLAQVLALTFFSKGKTELHYVEINAVRYAVSVHYQEKPYNYCTQLIELKIRLDTSCFAVWFCGRETQLAMLHTSEALGLCLQSLGEQTSSMATPCGMTSGLLLLQCHTVQQCRFVDWTVNPNTEHAGIQMPRRAMRFSSTVPSCHWKQQSELLWYFMSSVLVLALMPVSGRT